MQVHAVNGVNVIIMPVEMRPLGPNVLPQRGSQKTCLQIVSRQRVSCQQSVHISARDQLGKRFPRFRVKGACRSQHPDYISVLPFMFQQFVKLFIIIGKRGFSAPALAERKRRVFVFFPFKTVRVYINTLFAILGSSHNDTISLFNVAEFPHLDLSVLINGDTVHSGFLRQQPFPFYFEIFRENRGSVELIRRRHILRRQMKLRVR